MSYDPYYPVKEEIQQSIAQITSLHANWTTMVGSGFATEQEDFDWTEHELSVKIAEVKEDIQVVEETVEKARANKERFNLEDEEIERRMHFVKEAKEKVRATFDALNDPSVKRKLEKERRDRLLADNAQKEKQTAFDKAQENENDEFIESEDSRQKLIVRQQDEDLEELSHSVGILGQMGKDIGDELEEHAVLLEDLESSADRTDSNIRKATAKIRKIMKGSRHDYVKFGIIIALVILLAILIIIALYT